MNFTSTSDVDAALHATSEMRALLSGLNDCVNQMHAVLTRRAAALTDLREELSAHLAEIAERQRVA